MNAADGRGDCPYAIRADEGVRRYTNKKRSAKANSGDADSCDFMVVYTRNGEVQHLRF
jgi:hypothetical protein